ncbi:hypothetical protein C4546_04255 [Candidatus Parcubacteria bacterium]|jgi:hypothetical protein|nr:MAG: hypothetical protein C4546_04255 [Candidatus Parcubacteria bacterium]
MHRVIGCCIYEEEGMIGIYRAAYDISAHPFGGLVNRLVHASTRELRFPYDNRNGNHLTPEQVIEILKLNHQENFLND